ncbi:hypothetical protein SA496_22385 [Pseudomonas sp. JS3066]|jgi:hypothetical protein|uniref:hypothetical protein n=1 Tax=unclassified Pseudomonas TaxID=196821 RepID=UPI00129ECF44|nr:MULTISPECIES: hypothetical protein [unclassified Pseudomonas]MDH4652094.1 hypothetical protein [Pseudomonas sp. BN606]MRK22563.1 hypothetical protein [Pseudomonas sp. JG-B]WVK92433.1 hypothetical protein SA496_22385 [Pseudomonas sp. JS3066]
MLLAALLASASLQLHPLAPGQAEVRLCFANPTPAIRYELQVTAQGPAGRSRSRQSGVADRTCPVTNTLQLAPGTQVEAQLRWWVEGVEQEAQAEWAVL